MLIRLSADQTDLFGLSGADFFLVLVLQLVLVPLVGLLLVLVPVVLLVLEPFFSRPVLVHPHPYSTCNCQDPGGTLLRILYLRT